MSIQVAAPVDLLCGDWQSKEEVRVYNNFIRHLLWRCISASQGIKINSSRSAEFN
jgi:hypothetical protein